MQAICLSYLTCHISLTVITARMCVQCTRSGLDGVAELVHRCRGMYPASKGKETYSSLQAGLQSPLRELTCHMGSHSVTCHPAEVTFPPLPQPRLVLDLATPEGCKAELVIGYEVTIKTLMHGARAVKLNQQ